MKLLKIKNCGGTPIVMATDAANLELSKEKSRSRESTLQKNLELKKSACRQMEEGETQPAAQTLLHRKEGRRTEGLSL